MPSPTLPEHLFAYQREDALELLERPRRFLLEPMGAGKSVIAIAAIEALDAFTVVVVCPVILRADWQAKFTQFGRNNYSFGAEAPGRRVVVLSYEALATPERRDKLLAHVKSIDVLILDEAQRLKNIGARATESIYGRGCDGTGLVALAKRVWILSGTLAPNHCGELYAHLRANFPREMPQTNGRPLYYEEFLSRFCEWESTRWAIKVTGNKDVRVLRELLRTVAIQRTRAEVDAQQPALTVATVPLDRSEIDEAAYEEFLASAEGLALRTAVPELEAGTVQETASLAAARHRLGDLKANAVSTYARQLLLTDLDVRLLIFAHHHSVLRRIAFDLRDVDPGVALIDGTTPEAKRAELIEIFQRHAMRVLVLGIGTAREGVTLTAANRVLFAEASWVPAHNDQAIHRAARIGQTRPVIAEYLTVVDTLDEAVMRTCTRKTRLLSELFE